MRVATIERWERAHPHQRRKLPKLEHVALNSASETGAKMNQNAQICKLNFKNFLGAMAQTPYRRGAMVPLPRPHFPQRSGASRLASLARGLRPLHRPPTTNPGSTLGRTHPLKILATPMVTWPLVYIHCVPKKRSHFNFFNNSVKC